MLWLHLAWEYTEVMLGMRVRCNSDHSTCTRGGRPRILVTLLAVLVILTAALVPRRGFAGIRGPGKYTGVVIFDRWDSCILFSSVYLMYVSEKVKEGLRPYAGQAIQLDATKVVQPLNPGDGLIQEYQVLGPAPNMSHSFVPTVPEGLVLTARGPFKNQGLPAVTVDIRNEGSEYVRIVSSEIGIALLTRKDKQLDYPFDPSDGPSTAIITRMGIRTRGWRLGFSAGDAKTPYSYFSDPDHQVEDYFQLAPGHSQGTKLTFKGPAGQYQFIFGYGGGVHEGKCLASNMVSFDVPK